MDKSLSIAASVASIISLVLGFGGGYMFSQSHVSQDVSVSQPVSQNQQVQIVLQQVIADLPPEKRKFAEGVVESFSGVLKAADGSESEMRAAARDFRKHISEPALFSYDVVKSPFPLIPQRTVMLCDDTFSVAYTGTASGFRVGGHTGRSDKFRINGEMHSGEPGVVFEVRDGNKQLKLRYMEYLEGEKTPIMSFVCS